MNELKDYFSAATEDEGTPKTSQEAERIRPDSAKAPALKLHLYKREPKKAVIAQGLFKQQKGRCNAESEGAVCEGFLEIDHADGNPDNWDWGNLQLLCTPHHRAKTNRDRARRSTSLYVKKPGVSFDGAGLSPKSVSMENDKHENYVARFEKAAPAYFTALEWDGGDSPIVSIRTFRRAMIGACTYTDEAGRKHEPSQATLDRYVDAKIYPDNPDGWFNYAQTEDLQDGIKWAAKRPKGLG